MDSKEKKIVYKEVSKHHAANASEWLGALLRYLWFRGKRKFETFYNSEEYVRNAWIGTVLQIVILLGLFIGLLAWVGG